MKTDVATWIANHPKGPLDVAPSDKVVIHVGCGWCNQPDLNHHEANCPWVAAVTQIDQG